MPPFGSFIEQRFLAALLWEPVDIVLCPDLPGSDSYYTRGPGPSDADWYDVIPQAQIGNRRVDFLIVRWSGRAQVAKLIVECDGHEFHERTKAQAARDRANDRRMQALGYLVFRFTGSEIARDAHRCAREALGGLSATERAAGSAMTVLEAAP